MFGKILKRFKVKTSGIAGSAISADNVSVMEAMIAGVVQVAYADGTCSNDEVDAVNKLVKSNPQLKLFRNEPVRLFETYCDQMEASTIQGRIDMKKRIAQMSGDTENSERVLIAAIEVAFAGKEEDNEDPISEVEEDVLAEIARELDLRLGQYI